MRPLWAGCRFIVLRHLRGPVVLVVALLFGLVASSLPAGARAGTEEGGQGAAALLLGAGGLVLLGLAQVLPSASVALRRGRSAGGRLGPRGWQAAALSGHALVLVLAACLLGLLSLALVTLRQGWLDRRQGPPVVRELLDVGPAGLMVLGPQHPSAKVRLHFRRGERGPVPGDRLPLQLRLAPRILLAQDPQAPRLGSLRCPLDLHWRADGQGPWRYQRVVFRQGAAQVLTLPVEAAGAEGVLDLRLGHAAPGFSLAFPAGTLVLLGDRAPFLSSLMRGFLLLALGVSTALAFCQWLSGAVNYSLAVAASLTATGAAAVFHPWIPGVPLLDPATRFAEGIAIQWGDLLGTAIKAGVAGALVAAFPLGRPPARETGP